MPVLKNRIQSDFTMISNYILRDKNLSFGDRGLLCTLISLPDKWDFSVAGLTAMVPDGRYAISSSLKRLEEMRYLKRRQIRDAEGRFDTEIEVFSEPYPAEEEDEMEVDRSRFPDTGNPTRITRRGKSAAGNQQQYNIDNNKRTIYIDKEISISQSDGGMDGELIKQIARNIELDMLLETARRRDEYEVNMVNEVYGVICDMVCVPRDKVRIKKTDYPWEMVRDRFLQLRYFHVAAVLNRIVDGELHIKRMDSYLISVLYNESLVGRIEEQAELHTGYLKELRGEPY